MPYRERTIRSGGNNLYAGTLDGGAEASTTPLTTFTNGGINSGTGVYTPASGNPVSLGVVVGHEISLYADGASAPTGFVGLVTAVSSTTITVSTTIKSGTIPTTAASGITCVVGGAWSGPSGASGFPFNFIAATSTDSTGNNYPRVNFKNDQTYSMTAAMTHTVVGPVTFQGYSGTFGDGSRAVVQGPAAGASFVLLTVSGARNVLSYLIFTQNGATGSSALVTVSGAQNRINNCVFAGCRGAGLNTTNTCIIVDCEAYLCNAVNTASIGGFVSTVACTYVRCISHDNAGSANIGFVHTGGTYISCIADTNGLHGWAGTSTNGSVWAINCVAYGNGGSGILSQGTTGGSVGYMENNILVNNGTFGINISSQGGNQTLLRNNAFFGNPSGQTASVQYTENYGPITLTGDPFVAAATGNFSLNNTAGAGASCRAAGWETITQTQASYTGTTGYGDLGPAQHADPVYVFGYALTGRG